MRKFTLAAMLAFAMVPVAAEAQYFSAMPSPNESGAPFWNNVSTDNGPGCNIGIVLTSGPSTCNNNQLFPGFTNPFTGTGGVWYSHQFGNANQSGAFALTATGNGATLRYWGGIAGATPLRELAVRDLSTGAILHTFNAAQTTFTVAAGIVFDIGIAASSPFSGTPNFFSWTNVTPNQFVVFGNGTPSFDTADCGAGSCWVGAEDNARQNSDYDYQDGLLQISNARTVVPEPSTYALMAAGLLALGVASRRRRVQA